jgi:hypothetical protein
MRGALVRDGVRLASHRGGPSPSTGPSAPAAHPTGDFRSLLALLRGQAATVVDGRSSLGQRLTRVEDTLQSSVDQLARADAMRLQLSIALDALQSQFACESPLRGTHPVGVLERLDALEEELADVKEACAREAGVSRPPTPDPGTLQQRLDALETKLGDELSHPDTVLQRLDILEMKVSDERPLDVSAHAADAYLPPALYPGAVRQRIDELETKLDAHSPPTPSPGAVQQRLDALEAKVNDELMKVACAPRPGELRGDQSCSYALGQRMLWSLCAEKAAREAHQNSMRVGHAALEQRLDVVAQALHDSAGEHSSTLEAGLASMAHELRVEIHRAANWMPRDLSAARANPGLWTPAVEFVHEPRVSAPSSPPRS